LVVGLSVAIVIGEFEESSDATETAPIQIQTGK
jgi:hypothetical protein